MTSAAHHFDVLSRANWLTEEQAQAYGWLLLIVTAAIALLAG